MTQAPMISLGDIYYTLFRNKTKIILCTLLGIAVGVAIYLSAKPTYLSEARLFLRYVDKVTTAASLTENARNSDVQLLSTRTDGIIASELQILTSRDLIASAVENVGPEKFVVDPDNVEDPAAIPIRATSQVLNNLSVQVPRGSTIIKVSYVSEDSTLVQPVLNELISEYLSRHIETHRSSSGSIDNFLSQQTDKYRAQLSQSEEDLRREMNKAGLDTVENGISSKLAQIQRIREDIFATQAELAEHEATLLQLSGEIDLAKLESDELPQATSPASASDYRILVSRLASLRDQETTLRVQFTEESILVKEIRTRIEEVEREKQALEAAHPLLAQAPELGGSGINPIGIDPRSEAARVAALRSRLKTLEQQKGIIQAELDQASSGQIVIKELLRRIKLDEANYNNFLARLEQERINESFGGSGDVSGISIVQSPSPPLLAKSKIIPLAAGAAIAGLAFGLAWAFAIELYFDRSIKRPFDIRKVVDIPLFISIPDETKRLKARKGKKSEKKKLMELYFDQEANGEAQRKANGDPTSALDIKGLSQGLDSPLYPYYEALRDRLIGFFESRNLTHSPKLIGLTGLGEAPGVTTIAAGLANCLSNTEESNVLLVDMTIGQESSRQFYKGREICNLDEALETNASAHIKDNLYVVKENSGTADSLLPRVLPKRFGHLVPKLKASDFDYVIFDMPEVSPISVTPRLASFMDAMLMIVESEATASSALLHATKLMEQSNENLGVVLNKTKAHGPKFLQEEFFGSS